MTSTGTHEDDVEQIKKVIAGWEPLTVDYVKHLHATYNARCPFMEALADLGATNDAVDQLRIQLRAAVCV